MRSGTLARQALAHSQNPFIQAESYFLLARAEHAEGPAKYIDALEHVRTAFCVCSCVRWRCTRVVLLHVEGCSTRNPRN
jgi:hypothetical protein